MRRVLVDAGPLVALLSPRDSHHQACIAAMNRLKTPLYTCWPALVEAVWLLRKEPRLAARLLRAQDYGAIQLLDLPSASLAWCASFMERYRDLPADLADAALVYLAEHEGIETIFTTDERDFSIYRLGSNKRLKIIPLAR
jgi:uncharacterized protein